MRAFAAGKRFAAMFLTIVLVSSVASIPLRMNLFSENNDSPFGNLIDGIFESGIEEVYAASGGKKVKTDESGSPFQRGMKKGFQDHPGHPGHGKPQVEFEDPEVTKDENKITIKGKSKIKFNGPGQAGKDKWDDYNIEGKPAAGNGTVLEDNYNDLVLSKINEKALEMIQEAEESENETSTVHHVFKFDDDGDGVVDEDPVDGVDNDEDGNVDEDPAGEYEFGSEPREIEVEESYNLTFASEEDTIEAFSLIMGADDPMLVVQDLMALTTDSTTQNVLMGFTIAPPKIDWTIGTKQVVCIDLLFDEFCFTAFEARAGFFLEVGFGLRLPAQVTVTTVSLMTEEQVYGASTTSLVPLDFSEAQYVAMGVQDPGSRFGGNEFAAFLEFFLGVKVVIVEVTVIDWALQTNIDLAQACTEANGGLDCGNFVTPFGLDENGVQRQFPIRDVELSAEDTGLVMSFAGASLGIGLKLDPTIGSSLIDASWSAGGDATGSGTIHYTAAGEDFTFGPITAGNFDTNTDNAEIRLDDFTYNLNVMQLTLSATIDLGGWLSFVPDLPYVELVTIDLESLGFPVPKIGQHDGTPGVQKDVFVQHFGVDIEVSPETQDVEPGFFGNYTVQVTNTGNVDDTFDTFAVSGLLPNWNSTFAEGSVTLAPGASTSFTVGIMPWRHFSTSPGDYPFTVSGASEGAKAFSLVRADSDDDIVHVIPFFEPHVEIAPLSVSIKPDNTASYTILVQNFGNVDDSISLALDYPDFGDLYRVNPEAIPESWTTIGATFFGPLGPGESDTTAFTVSVPGTWEGMENATYVFVATTTSQTDTDATASQAADTEVIATKESMARYIDYEIALLIGMVQASSIDDELKQDLVDQLMASKAKNGQALDHILSDRFKQANNMLGSGQNIMEAFVSHVDAQNDKGIPAELADLLASLGADAMQDFQTAIAHPF